MEKKLNVAANLAIIVAAIAIVFTVVHRQVGAKSLPSSRQTEPTTLIGHTFPLRANWQASRKTVVLALQVGCHFCAASAPFYRKLSTIAKGKNVGIVSVLPQTVNVGSAYLSDLGIGGTQVETSPLSEIDVNGTPTLFVVDSGGVVQEVWQGLLEEEDQAKVLKELSN